MEMSLGAVTGNFKKVTVCLFVFLLFYIFLVFLILFFPREDDVHCLKQPKFCSFGTNKKIIKSFPQRLSFSCKKLKRNHPVRREGWGGEKGTPTY